MSAVICTFDDGKQLVVERSPWRSDEFIWKIGGMCVAPIIASHIFMTPKDIRGGIKIAALFELGGKVYYITKEEFLSGFEEIHKESNP